MTWINNSHIIKFNLYDYVEIRLKPENIHIKSYIYNINIEEQNYQIYNELTETFELIKFETIDVNLTNENPTIKLIQDLIIYWFGQPIEYFNYITKMWTRGFFCDYCLKSDFCYVVSNENFFIDDYENFKIKIDIKNIKKYIDDSYFNIFKIVSYNSMCWGRVCGINNKNNSYNYVIKFQNSHTVECKKDFLSDSNIETTIYFQNDIVLFKDDKGIIFNGIIYSINTQDNLIETVDIIKIKDNIRIDFLKNIKQSNIIKFVKNYFPSINSIEYDCLNQDIVQYIDNLKQNNFFSTQHLFYDSKFNKYFIGSICDYIIYENKLYFTLV